MERVVIYYADKSQSKWGKEWQKYVSSCVKGLFAVRILLLGNLFSCSSILESRENAWFIWQYSYNE